MSWFWIIMIFLAAVGLITSNAVLLRKLDSYVSHKKEQQQETASSSAPKHDHDDEES